MQGYFRKNSPFYTKGERTMSALLLQNPDNCVGFDCLLPRSVTPNVRVWWKRKRGAYLKVIQIHHNGGFLPLSPVFFKPAPKCIVLPPCAKPGQFQNTTVRGTVFHKSLPLSIPGHSSIANISQSWVAGQVPHCSVSSAVSSPGRLKSGWMSRPRAQRQLWWLWTSGFRTSSFLLQTTWLSPSPAFRPSGLSLLFQPALI